MLRIDFKEIKGCQKTAVVTQETKIGCSRVEQVEVGKRNWKLDVF